MRTRVAVIVAILLSVFPISVYAADVPVIHFAASKVLPEGWSVSGIHSPAVPYGLVKKPNESDGVAISFAGPKKTKDRMGGPAIESFTVYIMPKGFVGAEPPPPGVQFSPASKMLGSVDGCPFYAIWWSQIESWPDWEKDIQSYFAKKNG